MSVLFVFQLGNIIKITPNNFKGIIYIYIYYIHLYKVIIILKRFKYLVVK